MDGLNFPQSILDKAKAIRLLLTDVDGVLTNGAIVYDAQGFEIKFFHVQDGLGIKMLQQNGIQVGIITSRDSNIVNKRMEELGITLIHQGQEHKIVSYHAIRDQLRLQDSQIAYIGDDLPDLPVINKAGLGIAVANAHHYVKQKAAWVTTHTGGAGAVREVCEMVLHAQNKLFMTYENYL